MRPIKFIAAIVIFAGIAALIIWAFMEGRKELALEQEREKPINAPSRVSLQSGGSVVTLDKETQTKSGIIAAPLKTISHQEEVKAYGMVLELQGIVDLRNSYADARSRTEKARAVLDASRGEYERLKALNESGKNISDKAVQAANAGWRSDEANDRAAQAALKTIEAAVLQQWGDIIARWLFESSPVFERLLEQKDVLIQVTIPSDIHLLSAPQTILLQAGSGTPVSANLVSPASRTDPRIQGMSFLYTAHRETSGLIPGMNITAYLPVGPKVQGVVVPSSAVVWWQGKAWIYAQREQARFARQEISTEMPVKEGWFIKKAVSPEDRVVISGAQLLLSEEFRSQIQVGEEGQK